MGKRVVVVGAGIVGVSAAIWLQRDGHAVTLIDRLAPGEGTSYGNGGVLAASGVLPVPMPGIVAKGPHMLLDPRQPLFMKWRYLPRLAPWLVRYLAHANTNDVARRVNAIVPLVGDSLADHQALSAGTDAARWLVPSDYLYLYKDRAAFERDRTDWAIRESHGFIWDVLEGAALQDYEPHFGDANQFAAKLEGHGRISDPGRYVKDLARHLEKSGGTVMQATVDGFAQQAGKLTGVRAGGTTIACDNAVLTTGAWSGPLAKQLGLDVPMESERGYHLELIEPSTMPRAPVMVSSGKFVITPMEGRIRLAGIVEFGGLEAPASHAPFKLLEQNIRSAMPQLTWKETAKWMGHRPAMVDSLPMIGPVPSVDGVFVGFGHDHLGLTAGPKTGRLLAQQISGQHPNIDMTPYAPARFTRVANAA
ncbi:MAG: FAD-dependent oxidoreductase [Ahrensia sp.]